MQKLGIDYKAKLIGQGYDGASVMSGKLAGVATLIRNKAQFALYVSRTQIELGLSGLS